MLVKKKNGVISKIIKKDEQVYFIRRLYELIKHGYMLEDSLEFLMLQYNAPQNIIVQIKNDMSTGSKLSDILEKFNFSQSIVSKMKFSEHYGKVETMLLEIEKYLLIKKEQKEKIIKALRYPIILTTMLVILITIFNVLVIPQFSNIYASSNIPMDKQVQVLITILYFLPKILLLTLIFFILLFLYIFYTFNYKKNIFFKTIFRIPIINTYFKYYFSYQFSSELSLFLESGFPIKTALEEIRIKNYNYYFTIFASTIEQDLINGQSLEIAVSNKEYFSNSMSKFIAHGRRNSMLAKELKLFSNIMLDSFIKLIDKRLKKIQPILFMLLAFIIVGLYLVILLPIFNMTSAIK